MKALFLFNFWSIVFIGLSQESNKIITTDSFVINSKLLNEVRKLNVWTPPNYNSVKDSFPVIYLLDGGIKEDYPHMIETIAKLIQSKDIPPLIVVGIENTQRRRDLTGFTEIESDKEIAPQVGGSEQFRSFIEKELFSEINLRFRVTNKRVILGESLAGLFIIETFFLQANLFDYYIAIDPSLWWNAHYLIKNSEKLLPQSFSNHKKLWFAGSNTKSISKHTKDFARILKSNKAPNLTWKYSNEPKEDHSTIYKAIKDQALKWTFCNEFND